MALIPDSAPAWLQSHRNELEQAREDLLLAAEGSQDFGWTFAFEEQHVTVTTCEVKAASSSKGFLSQQFGKMSKGKKGKERRKGGRAEGGGSCA